MTFYIWARSNNDYCKNGGVRLIGKEITDLRTKFKVLKGSDHKVTSPTFQTNLNVAENFSKNKATLC